MRTEGNQPVWGALISIGEKIRQTKFEHDYAGEEPSLVGIQGPGVPIVGPLTAIGSAASSGERKGAAGFGNDAKEVHIAQATGPGVPIVGPLTAIGSAASSGERHGSDGFGKDAKEVHI